MDAKGDAKMGAKKRAKLEAKAEKKAQREVSVCVFVLRCRLDERIHLCLFVV